MSSAPTFPPPAAWVACPKCAAQVPCYDPAGSRYFGCWQCRTYFRAVPEAEAGHLVSGFKQELPPGPSLPLGTTGTLGGYQVRLTGYQVRGEKQDRTAEWREYQLRPVQAIAGDDPIDFPLQLAEFQGHWLLIRRATSFPGKRNGKPYTEKKWTSQSNGHTYQLWHRYQPVIRDAQGEFDWNILDDDALKMQEFICPPYLLSSEQAPGNKPVWYLSEYLKPAQVAAAFGLYASQLPSRYNTGAAEPNPHQPASAWRLFGVAALLLLALAAGLAIMRPGTTITQTFTIPATPLFTIPAAPVAAPPPADTMGQAAAQATATAAQPAAAKPAATPPAATAGSSQMLVSKTIELAHPAAVDITLSAPGLTDHWLEVTASLVNEQTGRGYEVTRSLEYYSGVEDGESWSEGDRSVGAVISGLPAGRYHLNLYPSPEAGLGETALTLELEQHTGFASNVVLTLLLMSVLPLYQWARHGAFETSRWENSDFAPTSD